MTKKNLLDSVRAKLALQSSVARMFVLAFCATMVGCGGGDSKGICFTTNSVCMSDCSKATVMDISVCHESCNKALKACVIEARVASK
jgi:hypothetical protein